MPDAADTESIVLFYMQVILSEARHSRGNAMPRSLPEPLPQIVAPGNGDALRAVTQVRFGVPRTGGGRLACV
ncbi:MAG TPA: hypothetical protein VEY92_00755, partial [Pseudoxanthomonas sp.]|nr:hypothetical protein [Pseudoxanthomonas sp.]